jgi:hypothetical protein
LEKRNDLKFKFYSDQETVDNVQQLDFLGAGVAVPVSNIDVSHLPRVAREVI